jgi:hypothetical protein
VALVTLGAVFCSACAVHRCPPAALLASDVLCGRSGTRVLRELEGSTRHTGLSRRERPRCRGSTRARHHRHIARRIAGESSDLLTSAGRVSAYGGAALARRGPSSAGTRARSRRSSSMRARIAGKSSAARGRVTVPPVCGCRLTARHIEKLWLTGQAGFPAARLTGSLLSSTAARARRPPTPRDRR